MENIDETLVTIRKFKQFVNDTKKSDGEKAEKITELNKNLFTLTRELIKKEEILKTLEEENIKLNTEVQLYKEIVQKMCQQYC